MTPSTSRLPTRNRLAAIVGACALAFAGLQLQTSSVAAEAAVKIPAFAGQAAAPAAAGTETAVFAGGCFWGIQGVFQHTKGVTQAVSGYAGGSKTTAHYTMVGSGMTGHAEAVKVN